MPHQVAQACMALARNCAPGRNQVARKVFRARNCAQEDDEPGQRLFLGGVSLPSGARQFEAGL